MMQVDRVCSLFLVLTFCCLSVNGQAQSFNCRSAKALDEIAICQNKVLSELDEQMAALFLSRRAALSETQQLLLTAQQQSWLRERMTCTTDVSCIEHAYRRRISQLTPFGTMTSGPAPQPGSLSSASILVPLQREGGTYVVPVLINKAITLNFTVDSGAADVSIPADVFSTLVRAGTIQKTDLLGTKTYTLADGSTRSAQTFRLRSLTLGGKVLEDVAGSVAPIERLLLLGQTFLGRFKSWAIDNAKQALVSNRKTMRSRKSSNRSSI
jgi:uncharacterized protein